MANQKGCDSAYAPSVVAVKNTTAKGITWWAVYLAGAGALHNWSPAEVNNLRQGGLIQALPVFVPALTSSGRISPVANPETDAKNFISACRAAGVFGVGALDTEASMRGDRWTAVYEARFGDALVAAGWQAVTYAGGFTMAAPPKYTPWWIVNSSNPPAKTCYQMGSGTESGTSVDYDVAGQGFPLATLNSTPPPSPLPPVVSSPYPELTGASMPSEVFAVPTDANGNGWTMCDGSDARINHLQVPWTEFAGVFAQGGYPPADGYVSGDAKAQDRNGYVCIQVTGAAKSAAKNVILLHTGAPSVKFLSQGDAEALHGQENIVTDENWQNVSSPKFGGGGHDPANGSNQYEVDEDGPA